MPKALCRKAGLAGRHSPLARLLHSGDRFVIADPAPRYVARARDKAAGGYKIRRALIFWLELFLGRIIGSPTVRNGTDGHSIRDWYPLVELASFWGVFENFEVDFGGSPFLTPISSENDQNRSEKR